MTIFLKAIFSDLLVRVQEMKETLIVLATNNGIHPDVEGYFFEQTIQELAKIENKILKLSVERKGQLEIALFFTNNLSTYHSLFRDFQFIELYRYRIIRNYSAPDHFFKKLIQRVYDDSNILATPPLVTTISNSSDYFWATPSIEVIGVPNGEEKSLLNLSDLYHEIGHLIFYQFQENSSEISSLKNEITHFFQAQENSAQWTKQERYQLQNWQEYYLQYWIEEFTCDIIGTYLTGPAYSWTNLKLMAINFAHNQIYNCSLTHPSDEARIRVIFYCLEEMNTEYDEVIVEMDRAWQAIISGMRQQTQKDRIYELVLSNDILKQIVTKIIAFCKNIDLAPYQPSGNKDTIAHLLNRAWEEVRKNPVGFGDWEKEKLKLLKGLLK